MSSVARLSLPTVPSEAALSLPTVFIPIILLLPTMFSLGSSDMPALLLPIGFNTAANCKARLKKST